MILSVGTFEPYQMSCHSSNWSKTYLIGFTYVLLLGLSKENARVEIPAWFFFFVRSQIAVKSSSCITHAQRFDSDAWATFWGVRTRHSVMADDEKLSRCKISTDIVYNTLKTHTKYAHIVGGRPIPKDVERFWNGWVRETYERSLY